MIPIILIICGYLLRIYVLRAHNATKPLCIKKPEKLLKKGIYGRIRHPMYLGSLIMFLGLALLLTDVKTALLCWYIVYNFILARILQEEQLLIYSFGEEYIEYMKKTKRLIPFIF